MPGSADVSSASLEHHLTNISFKTMAANPLIRPPAPASPDVAHAPVIPKRIHRLSGDPPSQIQRRNHQSGGKAATVAGDAGPGFHTWPPGHILQDTDSKPLIRIRFPANKIVRRNVRRRDRGQRPQLQKKPWPLSHILQTPDTNPPTRRRSRHCSRGRWPRFSHLAERPHPSNHRFESTDSQPVPRQKTFGTATWVGVPSYIQRKSDAKP
jgi:hypothetical protein